MQAYQERVLTAQEKYIFKPYFAENVIDEASIVAGYVPFWLPKNKCAVVLYNRIYFRGGVYQSNTKSGVALLGHELMHVSQFLHGMSLIAYCWSCRFGYRKSRYEIEAYAKGEWISANFQQLT